MSSWRYWFFFVLVCGGVNLIEWGAHYKHGWMVNIGQACIIAMFAIWFAETVE